MFLHLDGTSVGLGTALEFKNYLHFFGLYCACLKLGTKENYVLWILNESPLKITSCSFLRNQDGEIGYKIDIEKYFFFKFRKRNLSLL